MVRRTGSVGSFSTDICAILLISNIIRVYFWFAAGFGTPLLLQALLMISAQVRHRAKEATAAQGVCRCQSQDPQTEVEQPRTYEYMEVGDFSLENFWRWD